jgi:hypothetical protein
VCEGLSDRLHEQLARRVPGAGEQAHHEAAQRLLVLRGVFRALGRGLAGEQLDEQRADHPGSGLPATRAFGRAVTRGRRRPGGAVEDRDAGELHPARRVDEDLRRGGARVDEPPLAIRDLERLLQRHAHPGRDLHGNA